MLTMANGTGIFLHSFATNTLIMRKEHDEFPYTGAADAAGQTVASRRWSRRDKITALLFIACAN
jgi:hypothetical protein